MAGLLFETLSFRDTRQREPGTSRFRVRRFASPRNDVCVQANAGIGRYRRNAPMIMMTKNTSTMPWTTANTGPDGGLPGASAVRAGTLRKLWITSTNTLKYSDSKAV